MRCFILLLLLLPLPAFAMATLTDCDSASYEVKINNAGNERSVTVTPRSGMIREYGPNVSFAIKGHAPVTTHNQNEEYCIWHGRVTLQRISSPGGGFSGSSLR